MSAIDHFVPDTNNPDAEGFYLTPRWLGFYKLNNGSPYWPVKVGATSDGNTGEPFVELKDHPNTPTNYLRYTDANGLEIAGNITILSEKTPTILKVEANKNTNVSSNGAVSNTLGFRSQITGTVYVHFKVENADGGQIYWTNNIMAEPAPTWNLLSTGHTASGIAWFTSEIHLTGSTSYRAFQWRNVGTCLLYTYEAADE